jgi:hypothetical protein
MQISFDAFKDWADKRFSNILIKGNEIRLNSIFSELYTAQKNILTDIEKEIPEQIAEETRKLFAKEYIAKAKIKYSNHNTLLKNEKNSNNSISR